MKRLKVTSNAFRSIGYHDETQTFEVEYHSGHRYQGRMAKKMFERFINADSIGQFYNDNIKPYPNDFKLKAIGPDRQSIAEDEEAT
jgi:hypothetical protein